MTFSIAARDGDAWGVAVASKFLAVGSIVPRVEIGGPAVATQATARYAYLDELVRAVRAGATASAALAEAVAADEGREDRQVGVVAPDGAASYTGSRCLHWAGGRTGQDGTGAYAVQGNILTGPHVVDAMEQAWHEGSGTPLDERLVAIRRSHAYAPSVGVHERPTKTGRRGHRTVSLSPQATAALRAWRTAQLEAALAGELPHPVWVVSADGGATPVRPDQLSRLFINAREDAGVEGVRLHDLRHYVGTRLLSAGVPVQRVAGLLGHTSISTTMNVYRHWIPGEHQDLADLMGQITDGTSNTRSIR